MLLAADVRNLSTCSFSVGLTFNESKCKVQRITRKLNPVTASYELNERPLKNSTAKKDLAVVISDNLSWDKQVCAVCLKSNRMLDFVRRNTRCIKNVSVKRSIYLTLVRSHLRYGIQVWGHGSIELVCKMERIQRRASEYILNLPFHCQQSYKDRLIQLNLLSLTHCNEYLDIYLAADLGLSVACSLSSFKAVLYGFYKKALVTSYIPDDPRSFKSVCLICNAAHNLGRNIIRFF